METLSALLAAIPQPDVAGMARAQQHIDGLLKPPGSLGRLETLAVQLAGLPGLQGQLALAEKAIVVMCADHGVWHEGVTPSPQVVTAIHAGNMVRGNTGRLRAGGAGRGQGAGGGCRHRCRPAAGPD